MITGSRSRGVESGAQPFDVAGFDAHHVEAARRLLRHAHEVMPRRENDPALLRPAHAGRGAAEIARRALAHFDEDERGAVAHDEVDFAAAAPRRPIIARKQLQAVGSEVRQRAVLGVVAGLLGGRCGIVFPAGDLH